MKCAWYHEERISEKQRTAVHYINISSGYIWENVDEEDSKRSSQNRKLKMHSKLIQEN